MSAIGVAAGALLIELVVDLDPVHPPDLDRAVVERVLGLEVGLNLLGSGRDAGRERGQQVGEAAQGVGVKFLELERHGIQARLLADPA